MLQEAVRGGSRLRGLLRKDGGELIGIVLVPQRFRDRFFHGKRGFRLIRIAKREVFPQPLREPRARLSHQDPADLAALPVRLQRGGGIQLLPQRSGQKVLIRAGVEHLEFVRVFRAAFAAGHDVQGILRARQRDVKNARFLFDGLPFDAFPQQIAEGRFAGDFFLVVIPLHGEP